MEREVYTIKDMQQILGGVSYPRAAKKIREVKYISDRLKIRGLLHKLDWEDYLNRFNKKDSAGPETAALS